MKPGPLDRQPVLRGDLIELRPLREDDFEALFRVASDPLIWEQHPEPTRYQDTTFRTFFRDAVSSGGALVALDRATREIIGSSRFHGYDAERSVVEIGWTFLARAYWGGRYNGEMKRLMLEHAFQCVRRVIFVIGPGNRRSQRAVEKIGGVLAGTTADATGAERVVYEITPEMYMRARAAEKTRTFHRLHQSGCFVIPNPWDVGSARLLAQLGFPALATTSSGFAWSLGRSDNHVSLEEALAHFRSLAGSVEVPVSGDFEGGFAVDPEGVAANVAAATATGIAGLSIEDSTGDPSKPLHEFSLAVDRIRAARLAIDQTGTGVLLTGRSEGFIVGRPELAETIRRLTAYAEAGADCLYAPGIRALRDIEAVVEAVSPRPLNVLVGADFATVAQLAQAGVRRISVGGALARAAWTGVLQAAREIAEQGTFTTLGRAVPFADINGRFGLP